MAEYEQIIPLKQSKLLGVGNGSRQANFNDSTNISSKNGNRGASIEGFKKVYKVLMSPRCMNCHPIGDAPLQGDLSLPHTMNVQRGKDGKGLFALKCANCHQPENSDGEHSPPGNPNWHLPPADMKMVFEGKSPRDLAAQLLDPKRNGHKQKKDLIIHVSTDKLVVGCWNPGMGRTLPPMGHAEFVACFKAWIDNGAYLPDK